MRPFYSSQPYTQRRKFHFWNMKTESHFSFILFIKYSHPHTCYLNAFPMQQEREVMFVRDYSWSNTVLKEIVSSAGAPSQYIIRSDVESQV